MEKTIEAFLALPYNLAAYINFSFGTPVISSTFSGVYSFMTSMNSSNPSVRSPMNSVSCNPSVKITFIIPLKRATSVPFLCWRCTFAQFTRSIFRGSATIRTAPLLTAFRMKVAITGWVSVVLDPVTRMQSHSGNSVILLVIAPEPKALASPATVEAWQSLAQ